LAIEVLSQSNTKREMTRKLREYFDAGARLVWYVDPAARSVAVYAGPSTFTVVGEGSALDGGTVLPGFTLSLKELFSVLDEIDGTTSTPST
jgi:Uma2 family endonuclease